MNTQVQAPCRFLRFGARDAKAVAAKTLMISAVRGIVV
jgi:hypothetical protein